MRIEVELSAGHTGEADAMLKPLGHLDSFSLHPPTVTFSLSELWALVQADRRRERLK